MPTASSLVAAMSVEELRLYSQIPVKISMETSDGATTSTFGEVDYAVYFTWKQFAVGLMIRATVGVPESTIFINLNFLLPP